MRACTPRTSPCGTVAHALIVTDCSARHRQMRASNDDNSLWKPEWSCAAHVTTSEEPNAHWRAQRGAWHGWNRTRESVTPELVPQFRMKWAMAGPPLHGEKLGGRNSPE